MNYEQQSRLYGMSYADFMEMMRDNSKWWEDQVVNELSREAEVTPSD